MKDQTQLGATKYTMVYIEKTFLFDSFVGPFLYPYWRLARATAAHSMNAQCLANVTEKIYKMFHTIKVGVTHVQILTT